MSNREIRVIVIYMLIVGLCTFALGREIGVNQQLKKYEELKATNNNLYNLIQSKDKSYYELELKMIEYKWLYESCQTMFGDYQDKVEAGWYCE